METGEYEVRIEKQALLNSGVGSCIFEVRTRINEVKCEKQETGKRKRLVFRTSQFSLSNSYSLVHCSHFCFQVKIFHFPLYIFYFSHFTLLTTYFPVLTFSSDFLIFTS